MAAKKKKMQSVPQFQSEEEESDFWDSHSVTDYEAKEVTVEEILKAASQLKKERITLSLDSELVAYLKALAAKRHLPTSAVARELLLQSVKGAI
jgi:predicted DNA binding CopG/RHH family protein